MSKIADIEDRGGWWHGPCEAAFPFRVPASVGDLPASSVSAVDGNRCSLSRYIEIFTFSVLFLRRPFCWVHNLGESTENVNILENRTPTPMFRLFSSNLEVDSTRSTIGAVWGGLHACVTDVP